MMDVVIVDDEPAARRQLREFCAREHDLLIVGEYGDGRSALEAIRARPPNLLFLDIQMDSLNGIAVARALEPQTLPSIVFVTAYDHYALEAFEVCAIDYLLKPFDYERFSKSMARIRRRHTIGTAAITTSSRRRRSPPNPGGVRKPHACSRCDARGGR
jgi:two-component system LytT family response regulator